MQVLQQPPFSPPQGTTFIGNRAKFFYSGLMLKRFTVLHQSFFFEIASYYQSRYVVDMYFICNNLMDNKL